MTAHAPFRLGLTILLSMLCASAILLMLNPATPLVRAASPSSPAATTLIVTSTADSGPARCAMRWLPRRRRYGRV